MNRADRPLTSHQVIIDLIGATTTRTGLKVHAELDDNTYPTGIGISDAQMAALPITRHEFHGDWNYTLKPDHSEEPHVKHWQALTGTHRSRPGLPRARGMLCR